MVVFDCNLSCKLYLSRQRQHC